MEGASKFVLLTYANSGFYRVSQAAIANFQEMMPDRTIVYYDLGLTMEQAAEVIILTYIRLLDFISAY